MSKDIFPRDSFVFYRSFLDALNELSDSDARIALNAVCAYAMDGIEPNNLKGNAKVVFIMAKPQIDRNIKRYIDGCKGGEYEAKGAEFGKLGGRPRKE